MDSRVTGSAAGDASAAAVLGLDTTTSITTAGLVHGGRSPVERSAALRRGEHARSLPSLVEEVLAEAGIAVSDLGAVAVAVGPGSFTGIRLGIGFAKGIAFARGIPLVGVGTLDALAEAAGERERSVAACLDARKGEVYLAFYEPAASGDVRARDGTIEALPPAAAAARIAERFSSSTGALVVGDAAASYPAEFAALPAGIRLVPFAEVHPRGGLIAALGERFLGSGESALPEAVSAVYVRPSAAELSRGGTR